MKKLFITLITIACAAFSLSAQLQTGVLFGGGTWGGIDTKANPNTIESFKQYDANFTSSFMLGYRFRLHHYDMPAFLDLDAMVGLKNWKSQYGSQYNYGDNSGNDNQANYGRSVNSNYIYTAIGATANYYVYNKLSVGAGIEPTIWVAKMGEDNSKTFDIPLVAKIGYDFKFLELGLTYKYSFINSVKTPYLDSGRFNDLQLSVWVPF